MTVHVMLFTEGRYPVMDEVYAGCTWEEGEQIAFWMEQEEEGDRNQYYAVIETEW